MSDATSLTARLVDRLLPARELHANRNRRARGRRPRGIMLHYDGSTGADKWAVEWFLDPRCSVSYDRLYTDDGGAVQIIDDSEGHCAFHAGVCATELGTLEPPVVGRLADSGFPYGKANEAYFGYSVTTGPGHPATLAQVNALLYDSAATFRFYGWTGEQVGDRMRAHSAIAVFNPRDNPSSPSRWGRLGRKEDPVGPDPARPVLAYDAFCDALLMVLAGLERGAELPSAAHFDPHDPLGLSAVMIPAFGAGGAGGR